jgi:hypothetical protein
MNVCSVYYSAASELLNIHNILSDEQFNSTVSDDDWHITTIL